MRVKRRLLRSSSVDDRNDHGTGEVLLTLDIQLRLHDTLRDFARTLEIANEEPEVSEVVELGWHIGVLRAVTHVTQGIALLAMQALQTAHLARAWAWPTLNSRK